ncbi:basic helix-loop-helix (bHLH) DNA-bindingsuperfamily protein [Striga asiatica]|uniref:Basic helix-loop-helix (BHLH) DNA-bindingsuperfamily protein n=1 Tax=Striga asiatica TaxID=4170 RepID=A0A5A7PDK5_STRAF|nr:basic helix-loop-helix (bHLH) DNA-bindingsuperfamily protein [Striga asiatica]
MLRDFEGQSDLMDYIDEELAVILGHEFLDSGGRHPSPSGEPPLQAVESIFSGDSSNHDRGDCPWPATLDFRNNKNAGKSEGENGGQGNSPDAVEGSGKELRRDIEGTKRASKARRVRPASQTYDHIIAERKRREQLSRFFIALSTMVPGLKKMDKTSVLGDTINYLKHLQEKVSSLEEQVSRNTMESILLVSKSHVVEDEGSSDERSWAGPIDGPEIEARVSGKSVLLKVICEKQKGVLVRLVAEVENFGLTVVNTSVTPFGGFSLAITVIAEMDKEVSLSGKDMVKALRLALKSADN